MSNPLKATKFGLPFRHVPTYLAGYYKYKAGDQFTEGGKPERETGHLRHICHHVRNQVNLFRLSTERMHSPVRT